MKVKATGEFKKLGVYPIELGYIPEEGERFNVSPERYEVLKGNNVYNTVFIEADEIIREPVIIETAKKEIKAEKATRKTTKKSKLE